MRDLFAFHDGPSARVQCACFYINFYLIYLFICFFTTCTQQELSFRIIAAIPRYLSTSCVNIIFCRLFFLRKSLARPVKNKPTKKQLDAEVQVTLKQVPARKRTGEKMFYTLSEQITKPNYKLTILAIGFVRR